MLVKGVPGYKEYACMDELYECIVQQKLLIFTCAISLIAEQKGIDVMKNTQENINKRVIQPLDSCAGTENFWNENVAINTYWFIYFLHPCFVY